MTQPMNRSPSNQTQSPTTFTRQQLVDAFRNTDMAVTDVAANTMTTRLFATAAGQPLGGTVEALESAQLTEKSMGSLLLMAGFAPDTSVASQLGSRLWAKLNGLAEPATTAAAKSDREKSTPIASQELNATVLSDKSHTFERAGYMLQVMATLALDQMKRGVRGKVVRDFKYGTFRLTIRVSGNGESATISIRSTKGPTKPLYRTCGLSELWQFANPRDPGALDKIAKAMMENAELPVINGGREDVNEYAEGVLDADDGSDESEPEVDVDDRDDAEPSMRQLFAKALARSGKTDVKRRQP